MMVRCVFVNRGGRMTVDHSVSVNTTTGSATQGGIMSLRKKSITNWECIFPVNQSQTQYVYTVFLVMHHSLTWIFSSDQIVWDKCEKSPLSRAADVLLINQRKKYVSKLSSANHNFNKAVFVQQWEKNHSTYVILKTEDTLGFFVCKNLFRAAKTRLSPPSTARHQNSCHLLRLPR